MDLQTYLDNATTAAREERMKTSNQLTLGELILKLEPIVEAQKKKKKDDQANIYFDFADTFPTHLHSWRGSYAELAIGFGGGTYSSDDKAMTVIDFYKILKEAIGKTYIGWKGGDFVMGKNTPLWVSDDGMGSQTGIIEIVDEGYQVILMTQLFTY